MKTIKIFIAAVIYILLATAHAAPSINASSVASGAGTGYLDEIKLTGAQVSARGWILPANPAHNVVAISIWLNSAKIYDGRFNRFERQDVAAATGRTDRLNSGWQVTASIPQDYKAGRYAVTVSALLDSGETIGLSIGEQASFLEVGNIYTPEPYKRSIVLGLTLLILLALGAVAFEDKIANWLDQRFARRVPSGYVPGGAALLLFSFLVGAGTTGSSIEIGVADTPFVSSDGYRILGSSKPIRSDEWLLMTPLAIAQSNHVPRFPVINRNIGEDGHNMLIVGMTGAPVAHVSSLAKPATWGFHFFDLRRALAWYWWFPIFACFLSIWAVFNLISGHYSRLGFLISLTFCVSPYVVAWSNWPAYAAFFPAVMLYASVAILRNVNRITQLMWGIILGLSLAGFVLVLYPPWQITLGYLFLFLGVAIVVRDKLYLHANLFSLLSFVIGLSVTVSILWFWWIDASFAIDAITNTVYPGQRNTITGGSFSIDSLLRGYTNIVTLYTLQGGYSNQSEIASFNYFLLPLAVLLSARLWQGRVGPVHWALIFFILFLAVFLFVGVPKDIASITLLGRVPVSRADLALGLSYLLLAGVLMNPGSERSSPGSGDRPGKILINISAGLSAIVWCLYVAYAISTIPQDALSGFSPGIYSALFLFILVSSWWLAIGEYRKFWLLTILASLATTLPFNPLSVAPTAFEYDSKFIPGDHRSRVLVADTQIPAMFVLASGRALSNGIFYYPQQKLWQRLDPNREFMINYNRYQHLIVTVGSVDAPYYRIESPQQDVVRILVDSERFDFSLIGADILLAPTRSLDELKKNRSLSILTEKNGWASFSVL